MAPPIIKANLSAPSLPAIPQLSLASLLSGGRGSVLDPQDQEIKRLRIEKLNKSLNAGPSITEQGQQFTNARAKAEALATVSKIPEIRKRIEDARAELNPNNPHDAITEETASQQLALLDRANDAKTLSEKEAFTNAASKITPKFRTRADGSTVGVINGIEIKGSSFKSLSADEIKASKGIINVKSTLNELGDITGALSDDKVAKVFEQATFGGDVEALLKLPASTALDTLRRNLKKAKVTLGAGLNLDFDTLVKARRAFNAVTSLRSRLVTDGTLNARISTTIFNAVLKSITTPGENRQTGVDKLFIIFRRLQGNLVANASAFSNGQIETDLVFNADGSINENFGKTLSDSIFGKNKEKISNSFKEFKNFGRKLNKLRKQVNTNPNPKSPAEPLSGVSQSGISNDANNNPLSPEQNATVMNEAAQFFTGGQ